ncbi:MAG: hypothetical protein ABJK25_17110 [Halieaceae bacterium]
MQIVLVLLLLIIAAAAFLTLRKPAQKSSTPKARPVSTPAAPPYSSVSIMLPKNCCSAAQTLEGTRFLHKESPQLPLANCTTTPCKCGFIRHEDRRHEEEDRRAIHGLRAQMYALNTGDERRVRRGRRSYDLVMA